MATPVGFTEYIHTWAYPDAADFEDHPIHTDGEQSLRERALGLIESIARMKIAGEPDLDNEGKPYEPGEDDDAVATLCNLIEQARAIIKGRAGN